MKLSKAKYQKNRFEVDRDVLLNNFTKYCGLRIFD